MSPSNLISLVGQNRGQLADSMASIGVSESQIRMRVNQLYHWIYERGVSDFDAMLNLSKSLRSDLKENFTLGRPEIVEEQVPLTGRVSGCSDLRALMEPPGKRSMSRPFTYRNPNAGRCAFRVR